MEQELLFPSNDTAELENSRTRETSIVIWKTHNIKRRKDHPHSETTLQKPSMFRDERHRCGIFFKLEGAKLTMTVGHNKQ